MSQTDLFTHYCYIIRHNFSFLSTEKQDDLVRMISTMAQDSYSRGREDEKNSKKS